VRKYAFAAYFLGLNVVHSGMKMPVVTRVRFLRVAKTCRKPNVFSCSHEVMHDFFLLVLCHGFDNERGGNEMIMIRIRNTEIRHVLKIR
jgi:hypothetical protein